MAFALRSRFMAVLGIVLVSSVAGVPFPFRHRPRSRAIPHLRRK